ncbi:hypothetical protein CIB48_g7455 [Xylaria polymorpha]|nr:hypothetical protein CIB48_g7455 [Xylaria polymorpha]
MLYRKVFAAQANQLLWRGSGHAAWLPHPSLALGDHGCQAVCVWVCDSGANGSWTSEMHPRRLRAVEGFKIMIMEPARAALSSHLTGLPMLIPSNLLPEASNCFAVSISKKEGEGAGTKDPRVGLSTDLGRVEVFDATLGANQPQPPPLNRMARAWPIQHLVVTGALLCGRRSELLYLSPQDLMCSSVSRPSHLSPLLPRLGRCSPFVLLAVWGALGRLGMAAEVESRDDINGSGIPSVHDFIRRGCHTVAVLGDYLYIDGGQLTERVNGMNTTWSIDLTEAWTAETVPLRAIWKTAPLRSKQIHWTDPSTTSLYTWGGITSDGSPPSQDLWRFQADGSGGGSWTQVTQRDFLTFSKLKGTSGSAFTQTTDVGFAFGGAATKSSDSSVAKDLPGYATPGLVSYNFQTGEWENSTTSSYGGYGTSLNARAEYVPFGPNGLLLFLGGAETPVDATNDTIVETNWNRITMVDPVTKQWHTQTTSGTKPPTIESHCSVGVPGPNGTYEIYLYGGVSYQLRDTSPEVYVLSLPGFVFFEGPTDAPPRSDHQSDPWPYGIGILDMTELKWTDSYDPDALAYDSPAVVKEWYDAGNLENMHWDSTEVEAIFMNQDLAPSAAPTHNAVATNSHSTGAIVGGAVGGVLGVAALSMMSFMLVRRSRRARVDTPDSGRQLAPGDSDQEEIAEYKPEPWPKDHQGSRYTYSPDSVLGGGAVHSPSISRQPYPHVHYAETYKPHNTWLSELSGHQDGIVPIRGGELPGTELRVSELMDPNTQWAYELPAPLHSPRPELPDRKYSR